MVSTITTMQVESISGKITIDEKVYQVSVNGNSINCFTSFNEGLQHSNINVSIDKNTKKTNINFNNVISIDEAWLVAKSIETKLLEIITELEIV